MPRAGRCQALCRSPPAPSVWLRMSPHTQPYGALMHHHGANTSQRPNFIELRQPTDHIAATNHRPNQTSRAKPTKPNRKPTPSQPTTSQTKLTKSNRPTTSQPKPPEPPKPPPNTRCGPPRSPRDGPQPMASGSSDIRTACVHSHPGLGIATESVTWQPQRLQQPSRP